MATPATNLSTGVLLLACAGLGAVVAFELAGEPRFAPEVTAAAPAAPALPVPEPVEYAPPPPGAFAEIARRPLFSESRRPYVAPVAETAEPEPEPEPVAEALSAELQGVLVTGRQQAALVRIEGADPPVWLHVGQSIAGWVLEAVEHRQATLRSGDRVEVLQLKGY
jgi:general secretion pathway protein N